MSAPITITGRLTADPELKITQGGVMIANLRVVTSKRKKEGDEWKDVDTTYWSVTAFRQLAENVVESLSKGDTVVVVGTVKGRQWEDPKSGEKRTAFEITADEIGAGLTRATAKVNRIRRESTSTPGSSDPWAGSSADNDPWASKPADAPGEIPF